jgi:hypothetical protein
MIERRCGAASVFAGAIAGTLVVVRRFGDL